MAELGVVVDAALSDLEEATFRLWGELEQDDGAEEDANEDPYFKRSFSLQHEMDRVWRDVERSLREEARYLNPSALAQLDEIFEGIETAATTSGEPVVISAGPGTAIELVFRARVFPSADAAGEALAHPARLLGAPPAGMGRAGRMNARGQPAFYAAMTPTVALAEVRPPVGGWVVVAGFRILREVRLLDLRRMADLQMDPALSLFHPDAQPKATRRDFLRRLSDRLSQPVLPEFEDRDYLITQVIADYLSMRREGPLDGIVYPSKQAPEDDAGEPGVNLVLFPKSCRVVGYESSAAGQAQIWESEDDSWYLRPIHYPATPARRLEESMFVEIPGALAPTLAIDLESMHLHRVRSLTVETTPTRIEVERRDA